MASEELIQFAIYLATPFFVWIGIIIFLAAIGKSCGVRALYIKVLLAIFEWGKQKTIEFHQNKALGSKGSAQEQHHEEEEEEIISEDEDIKLFNLRHTFSPSQEETEDGRSPSSEWGKARIKVHEQHQKDEDEGEEAISGDDDMKLFNLSFSAVQEEVEEKGKEEGVSGEERDTLEPMPALSERRKMLSRIGEPLAASPDVSAGHLGEDQTQSSLPNGDSVSDTAAWSPGQIRGPWMDIPRRTSLHVIAREFQLSPQGPWLARHYSIAENKFREFQLGDIMYFARSGIEAIIEDEVTKRFSAEELNSWNLLTRTNTRHEFISLRLTALWFIGWVLRYIILLPFRACLAIYAIGLMILGTAGIGYMPDGKRKRWCYDRLSLMCYRVMGRAFSAVVTFHNKENRAKGGGICVANHTSPIDIIILGGDNTYAMVGQAQGGFFGIMQRAMSRAEHHVWFHREESKDRLAVASRLKEHVEDKTKLPILIFPEGTCINNTSIMMFKKGSFEVGGKIYPVAIKYDPKFADAFWNSSQQSFVKHLLLIMTSWAIVCDVWYLPPEVQRPDEDAIQFANRVKAEIAMQGGLVDLEWDGGLKRSQPKSSMKQKQQEEYSKRLKGE